MRRLLAAAATAAVIAAVAACGNGDDSLGQADSPTDDNTPEVCAEAEMVQLQMEQQMQQELAALQAEESDGETFEQETVEIVQEAFLGWSEGLRGPADRADDQELGQTLNDLADGLEEVAPQLTIEALQTGELPGAADLDEFGFALNELCATPPTPGQ